MLGVILSIVGIVLALCFIGFFAIKGKHIMILAPVAALIIGAFGAVGIENSIVSYMGGFGDALKNILLIYMNSLIISALMTRCGYCHSIAYFIADHVGAKRTPIVCMLFCVLMTIAGASTASYIIMYQIGLVLCSTQNYSRGFLAAAAMCGTWNTAAVMPFGATLYNGIMCPAFDLLPTHGFAIGMTTAIVMFAVNALYLQIHLKRKCQGGFDSWEMIELDESLRENLPPVWKAFIPIILVLCIYNFVGLHLVISVAIGSIYVSVVEYKKLKEGLFKIWENGAVDALPILAGVACMTGVGAVLQQTEAWGPITSLLNPEVNPYLGTAAFIWLMGILCGSSQAALNSALPTLIDVFPTFVDRGANLEILSRVAICATNVASTLPYSGSVIACLNLFKTNHKESYMPIFMTLFLLPSLVVACVTVPIAMLVY